MLPSAPSCSSGCCSCAKTLRREMTNGIPKGLLSWTATVTASPATHTSFCRLARLALLPPSSQVCPTSPPACSYPSAWNQLTDKSMSCQAVVTESARKHPSPASPCERPSHLDNGSRWFVAGMMCLLKHVSTQHGSHLATV